MISPYIDLGYFSHFDFFPNDISPPHSELQFPGVVADNHDESIAKASLGLSYGTICPAPNTLRSYVNTLALSVFQEVDKVLTVRFSDVL